MHLPNKFFISQKRNSFLLPAFAFTFFMIQILSAQNWKQLPSLPMGMGNFVAGTAGDDILLGGGITWKNETKIWLDQIWRFDAKKSTWAEAGKLPQPLAYAAFAQSKNHLYFSGGSDGTKTSTDFCELNAKLDLKKIEKIERPTVYSATAICGKKLFVMAGGADAVDLKTLTNVCYSIDLSSGKTEMLPEFPGGNLIVPTAAAIHDAIYIFTGGYVQSDGKAVNVDSAFTFHVKDHVWKKIKAFPHAVRGLASCALDDRYIFLGGGYTNDFTDAAFIYDTKTDNYFPTKPLPYPAMATMIKAGENLYWLGGEDKMRHRSDLFYVTSWTELLREMKLH